MSLEVTLENLISIIRECQGFSEKDRITEASLLEKDLGISGDDGSELLEAIEKQFDISFAGSDGSLRDAFGLSEGQYLFHSEGMNLFWLIASLFGRGSENVKSITVGELYLAARHAQEKKRVA
jgi:acyl carrier protein